MSVLPKSYLFVWVLFAVGALVSGLLWWVGTSVPPATLADAVGEGPLEQRLTATRQVSEGKRRAVAELLAGRLTLRETAARFRKLDTAAVDPDGATPFRLFRGEEEACRKVLGWVEIELRDRPDQAAGIVARLRQEYRDAFCHDPDPQP